MRLCVFYEDTHALLSLTMDCKNKMWRVLDAIVLYTFPKNDKHN